MGDLSKSRINGTLYYLKDATARQEVAQCVNNGTYDSNSKKILLKHGNTVVVQIDATDFIKDGMVSSVVIQNGNLVITFNTDAGQEPIVIPLTDIFNPNNYYTKSQVDDIVTADVIRTQSEATFVNSSNQPVFYLRQASSTLAGLMTSAEHNKLSDLPSNSELTQTLNGKVGIVDNGAYDVTVHNSNATFASLQALLNSENLSTLIPTDVRKGGMSIKFVQSSDNQYVQFFCTADEFTTDVTKWQGVDVVPNRFSNNLVESSGVFKEINRRAEYEEIESSAQKISVVENGEELLSIVPDKIETNVPVEYNSNVEYNRNVEIKPAEENPKIEIKESNNVLVLVTPEKIKTNIQTEFDSGVDFNPSSEVVSEIEIKEGDDILVKIKPDILTINEDVILNGYYGGQLNKKIVIEGDSITYGYNPHGERFTYYAEQLVSKLKTVTVVNTGVNGSLITKMASKPQISSQTRMDGVIANNPDIILLLAGTNDYRAGAPLGNIGDNTDETFSGALELIIQTYLQALPDTKLIYCTPLPWYFYFDGEATYHSGRVPNSQNHTLRDYCNRAEEICKMYSIPVVDTNHDAGWLDTNEGISYNFTTDGVHLSEKGYNVLTNLQVSKVKQILNI